MTIETRPVQAPTTEPKVKTVADVLRHAALIIEERGWWSSTQPETIRAGKDTACVLIAIDVAARSDTFLLDAANEAMRRWLGVARTWRIGAWNDAPGRTAAEVTAALRSAAAAWERDR